MKGIIFNLNNNIKNIDGYNFIINMLKNLNIPWIELKNDSIYDFYETPIDIENCIFISDSQENLNLAQNLNIKYAINEIDVVINCVIYKLQKVLLSFSLLSLTYATCLLAYICIPRAPNNIK